MSNAIISIQDFSKYFGSYPAVKNLSFEVQKGEVFAFLGGNGSGKTTTIRCLLDIYQPTQGVLHLYGEPFNFEVTKKIGYLPEERGLYINAKVLETLVYFGELKGLSRDEATDRATQYLEDVGLGDKGSLAIKSLSSGQQQKIQLGVALINQPDLLILDEPTKGLDPVNRKLLMDKLLELNKKGSTVIFITHQMEEVEKIADRLVMIQDGTRVLYGSVDEVKRSFGTNVIHLSYDGDLPQDAPLYTAVVSKHTAEITPADGVTTNQILQYLLKNNVRVYNFEISQPSLEEIFVIVSGKESYEVA